MSSRMKKKVPFGELRYCELDLHGVVIEGFGKSRRLAKKHAWQRYYHTIRCRDDVVDSLSVKDFFIHGDQAIIERMKTPLSESYNINHFVSDMAALWCSMYDNGMVCVGRSINRRIAADACIVYIQIMAQIKANLTRWPVTLTDFADIYRNCTHGQFASVEVYPRNDNGIPGVQVDAAITFAHSRI